MDEVRKVRQRNVPATETMLTLTGAAAIALQDTQTMLFSSSLGEFQLWLTNYAQVLAQHSPEVSRRWLAVYQRVALKLMGTDIEAEQDKTVQPQPWLLIPTPVDEGESASESEGAPGDRHGIDKDDLDLFVLSSHQMFLAYLFGEVALARDYAEGAQRYGVKLDSRGMPSLFYFVDSLVQLEYCAGLGQTAGQQEQGAIAVSLQRIAENQRHLKLVQEAQQQQQYDLVVAQKFAYLKDYVAAMDRFDQAIAKAKTDHNLLGEALANELAAKFYLDWGKKRFATGYLQDACDCYGRWGAQTKVTQLKARYPQLLRTIDPPPITQTKAIKSTNQGESTKVEPQKSQQQKIEQGWPLNSILQASQSLSRTMQLDELLSQLTQLILQHSGGDYCALVSPNISGEWQVRAIATTTSKTSTPQTNPTIQINLCAEPLTGNQQIPEQLIHHVKQIKNLVVINHLNSDHWDNNLPVIDDYLRHHQPQSILCLPILNQDQVIGILYLSERSQAGLFTEERIAVLNFLCLQAAFSLQNAYLYQQEQKQTTELKLSEQRFRNMFDNAADAVMLLSETGFLEVNRACLQLFGFETQADVVDLHPAQLSPEFQPDGQASLEKATVMMQLAHEKGCHKFEWMHHKPDGTMFWAEVMLTPIPYADRLGRHTDCIHAIVRDISDRKVVEQQLQESQNFLQTVLDTLPLSMFWKDRHSRYLGANANFVQDAGFTKPSDLEGLTDFDMPWAETEALGFRADDQEVMEFDRPKLGIIETQLQASGYKAWLETNKLPIHDVEGKVIGVMGTYQNITDRQRAEDALQQSEAKFRNLLSNLDGVVYRCLNDEHWTMEFMSLAIADLSGYPATDFIQNRSRTFASIIHPDDLDITYGILDCIEQNKPYDLEYRLIHRDGTIRWVTEKGKGVFNAVGEVTHFDGVIFDISDRKLAEEALRASETKFRNLLTNLDGVVYRCLNDENWTMEFMGEAIAKLSGYPATDFIDSKQRTYASIMHPDDIDWIETVVADSLAQQQTFVLEYRIIQKDGSIRWVIETGKGIQDKEGNLTHIEGVILDINDRKQAEEAILQKSAALEQTLAELQTAQLQVVQNEKMSALGNLVAGIAHEINNPISFLKGNIRPAQEYLQDLFALIQLYQDKIADPDLDIEEEVEELDFEFIQEDLPNLLQSMLIGIERIQGISNSLRTFSRKDQDQKTTFNLHDGINSTLVILKHRTKANSDRPAIQIVQQYGDLPEFLCFPGQLNQVFMNILANAIDACDEANQGKSFMEIKANPNIITIETKVEAGQLQLQFQDNGCGMEQETAARLFEQGFTTKEVGKGTGLGMAIARQIVEETHGGRISCTSQRGQGSIFKIELPL